jgi:hypothetical protein
MTNDTQTDILTDRSEKVTQTGRQAHRKIEIKI